MKNMVIMMDIRIKLIVMLIYIFGMISIHSIRLLGMSLFFLLLLVMLLGISLSPMLKRLFFIIPFMIAMVFIVPFQIPGESIFDMQIGMISIAPSYEGVIMAFTIGLKAIISMLSVFILTETTTVNHLLLGMRSIGIPAIMVQIIEFTLRYFIIIHQEFNRINTAQKSRGFNKGKNIFDTYTFKILGNTIGHVFVRSLDRSERIYRAMISRGYQRDKKVILPFHPQKIEIVIAFVIVLLTSTLIFIDLRL